MKILKLFTLVIFFSSCNRTGDGPIDNYDLSHHYEPHVTIRHSGDNETKHYYSVMLVVKKGSKVYAEKANDNGVYAMKYYFSEIRGEEQVASKTYELNTEYELRLYEYPVSLDSKIAVGKASFFAEVADPPAGHPHGDPVPLHNGTIHTPGGS